MAIGTNREAAKVNACDSMVLPPVNKLLRTPSTRPTSPTDDKSMNSLAISEEAGGVALQLSRSHSQSAVTLSKSELK
jgi:hypothetical protein